MEVKVGNFVIINNPDGAYLNREMFKKYIEDEVPFYDNKNEFKTELKNVVGKVLSIVPHPDNEDPIALISVESLGSIVAMDIKGGFMSLVQDVEYKEATHPEQDPNIKPNTVTEESIKKKIIGEQYMRMGQKTTICLLTVDNGFEVVGSSACVDPNNLDFELSKKCAYKDAFEKLRKLEGYLLQSNLGR